MFCVTILLRAKTSLPIVWETKDTPEDSSVVADTARKASCVHGNAQIESLWEDEKLVAIDQDACFSQGLPEETKQAAC